jgi:hypothetical protein
MNVRDSIKWNVQDLEQQFQFFMQNPYNTFVTYSTSHCHFDKILDPWNE